MNYPLMDKKWKRLHEKYSGLNEENWPPHYSRLNGNGKTMLQCLGFGLFGLVGRKFMIPVVERRRTYHAKSFACFGSLRYTRTISMLRSHARISRYDWY